MRPKIMAIAFLVLAFGVSAVTVHAATELQAWGPSVKVEGMSATRVSAVWYKDQLHIAHGGKNRDEIWHASWDGAQWMVNNVSNLSGEGGPSLAVFQDKLHMVYKGKDDTLWHATGEGKNWTSLGRIPKQKSHYSPAVVAYPYDRATGQPKESLWMMHAGGSKDRKAHLWFSVYGGSAWSDDEEVAGASEATVSLCMHKDRLYMATTYSTGINVVEFLKGRGWAPLQSIPKGAHSTVPVSLVSDGENLYMFYRNSRSEEGKEEPVFASVFRGTRWEDPVQVRDFTSSGGPAAVAVPGQKGKFYLLFTRNKDIYLASPLELKKEFKPLRQIGK